MGDTVGSAATKVGDTVGSAADKAKMPALVGTAAAAGLLGGLALRSAARGTIGKVPVPNRRPGTLKSVAHEVHEVGKEIGKAGFRLGVGDVSMEVQRGRRRRETRDSPLEVLLNGLTQRRANR